LVVPAPDLVEPVVGFRHWRLSGDGLRSMFRPVEWQGPEMRARCLQGKHDPRPAPHKACSCGIYAYYDLCPLTASVMTSDLIAGVVIVWGTLELHSDGMRASNARIVGLSLPIARGAKRQALAEMAERLGVPAVPHRKLRGVGAEHGRPLQRSLRPANGTVDHAGRRPAGALPRTSAFLVNVGHGRARRAVTEKRARVDR
jgi:hypothetical protein